MEVCYSFHRPVFKPAMRVITAVSNGYPAQVTTSLNHLYVSGLIVRLDIFSQNGMQQAHQQFAPITVTGDTTFTIDIDTTNYDPFVIPSPTPAKYTCSQCVPIAELNSMLNGAVQNVLPYSAS